MIRDDHWSDPPDDHQTDPATPAFGTMIIRTWYEPGHPPGFRARITYGQTPGMEPSAAYTADPAEVLRVVQEWLAAQPGAAGGI